jgi:hypothetical protein
MHCSPASPLPPLPSQTGLSSMAASSWPKLSLTHLAVPAHTRRDMAEGQMEPIHLPFFVARCAQLSAPYIHPLRTRTIESTTHTIAVPPQMMPKP